MGDALSSSGYIIYLINLCFSIVTLKCWNIRKVFYERSFTLSLLSGPHNLVDGKLFKLRRLVIKLKLEHTFILEK